MFIASYGMAVLSYTAAKEPPLSASIFGSCDEGTDDRHAKLNGTNKLHVEVRPAH